MNQLTTDQIARILTMYMPCEAIVAKSPSYPNPAAGILNYIDLRDNSVSISTEEGYYLCDPKGCRIYLTPVTAISDEHIVELAKISGWDIEEVIRMPNSYKKVTQSYLRSESLHYRGYLFLVYHGYAVPLFFDVSHPDNGKTAIELGIAIDKTKPEEN